MATASKRTAAKPVASSSKAKKTVTTETDPLADLGLTDTAPTTTAAKAPAASAATATETATETETASREEVEVGEIEFGFDFDVPVSKRRTEGSKYQFDKLAAPGKFEDGPHKGKPKIANFFVKLQPGVDADKLRRSVQSATTQANKTNKDKYFVSRTVADADGKFIGMKVLRTDNRPE